MRRNEVKKTIEQLVRVEYIAEDGTVFHDEEECKKYEESALFAVSRKLKRLSKQGTTQDQLCVDFSCEYDLEIFDVRTKDDLENLKRYLYLKARKNGASEKDIEGAFTSVDGTRKDFVFDGVTIGHEVLIFWSYDNDWFWVYKDGSLAGFFDYVRENYNKIISVAKSEEA